MKNFKKHIQSAIVFSIVIAFISSCGTSNDVVSGGFITKRKFNKGFHINTNKKLKFETESVALATQTKSDETINEEKNYNISADNNNDVYFFTDIEEDNYTEIEETSSLNSIASLSEKKEVTQTNKVAKNSLKSNKVFFKQAKKGYKYTKNKQADDTELILLVILCFIIPPLAVYLHEGQEWTTRCTINLILTLLCGLPGVIHGLIVVLGD